MSLYVMDEKNKRHTFGEILSEVYDHLYPIGSIYMSVSGVNPSEYFGGTWVAWGSGKVPVGVDANDIDFDAVETTGGEKKHQLLQNEMPNHGHGITADYNMNARFLAIDVDDEFVASDLHNGTTNSLSGEDRVYPFMNTAKDYRFISDATTATSGGNIAHNNLQPYITCHMWKRTA